MNRIVEYLKGDRVIWVLAIIMTLISMISVYSFVPVLAKHNGKSETFYLFKHAFTLFSGLGIMYWIHTKHFKSWDRLGKFLYVVAVILLVLTMLFGAKINGAERWLRIPVINFQFQTSDLAKTALIIYLAKLLVEYKDRLDDWKDGLRHLLLPVVVIVGLIMPQNLSTAVLLFGTALALLFVGKVPVKKLALTVGGASALLVVMLGLSSLVPELLPRVETWKNRMLGQYGEEDATDQMQIENAQMAIFNGEIWGKGPGKGELKQHIPEAYADFFYASFVEEYGIIGGVFLVFIYLILLIRIIRIAMRSSNLFGTYLCIGLGLIITSQAVVNMAVCTKLIPVTGQNMPLLGMGGTSIWFTCISLGIILSVDKHSRGEDETEDLNTYGA